CLAPRERTLGFRDDAANDLTGRADIVNEARCLTDENTGVVGIARLPSACITVELAFGVFRRGKRGFTPVPIIDEAIFHHARSEFSGPLFPAHDIDDASADGGVAVGVNRRLLERAWHDRFLAGPQA